MGEADTGAWERLTREDAITITMKTDDVHAPSQTCLSGVSGGRLETDASVQGTCAGHTDTDDSFVCSGLSHFIEVMRSTGLEDFTLSVSLALEKVDGMAASIVFFAAGMPGYRFQP